MKQSNLWNGASLVALAIFAGGCAAKMAALKVVDESSINSRHDQPQLDMVRTAAR